VTNEERKRARELSVALQMEPSHPSDNEIGDLLAEALEERGRLETMRDHFADQVSLLLEKINGEGDEEYG
jgi:hypothetical protein